MGKYLVDFTILVETEDDDQETVEYVAVTELLKIDNDHELQYLISRIKRVDE